MRGRACISAGALLAKRAAGLDPAERVRLESHLNDCNECAADADALTALSKIVDGVPALSPFARNRAINAALGGEGKVAALRQHRRWPILAIGFVAAAAAALLMLTATRDAGSDRADVAVNLPPPADRVIAGAIEIAGQPAAAGAAIPAGTEITTSAARAELAVAHAHIVLEPDTALLWHEQLLSVELHEGVIAVSVDSTPQRRFRVTTADFTVEVVGTEFTVARDLVTVSKGRVLVLTAGEALLAELGPGDEWRHQKVAATAARADETTVPEVRAALATPPQRRLGTLLTAARGDLASGKVAAAEAIITEVLGRRARPAEHAEARTLLAECALVKGQSDLARRRYLAVAERYRRLAAGENALFAAARLASPDEARQLLRTYLERYPAGRFNREARRSLATLD